MLGVIGAEPRPERSESGRTRFATEPWQWEAAERIRHQVFVLEQGVFPEHDRDDVDNDALTIIAVRTAGRSNRPHLGRRGTVPVADGLRPDVIGTVRIHRDVEPRVWWGSRLAVLPSHRGAAVTACSLIRKAVASACAVGCDRFLARIQPQNLRLFQRLGWDVIGEENYQQQLHLLVEARLDQFRPGELLDDVEFQWARYLGSSPDRRHAGTSVAARRWSS